MLDHKVWDQLLWLALLICELLDCSLVGWFSLHVSCGISRLPGRFLPMDIPKLSLYYLYYCVYHSHIHRSQKSVAESRGKYHRLKKIYGQLGPHDANLTPALILPISGYHRLSGEGWCIHEQKTRCNLKEPSINPRKIVTIQQLLLSFTSPLHPCEKGNWYLPYWLGLFIVVFFKGNTWKPFKRTLNTL